MEYTITFNEDDTVTIPYEMLTDFLSESRLLSALVAIGVDNWDGYDQALELVEEWDQMDQLATVNTTEEE